MPDPTAKGAANSTDRNCRKQPGKPESSPALHTDSEVVRPGDDPFDWGRFTAFGNDSAASLAAKLDGWYSLVQDAWRRLRRRPMATVQKLDNNAQATPSICS